MLFTILFSIYSVNSEHHQKTLYASAHGQDRWIEDYVLPFLTERKGIFVEAGMFDGRTGSNMYLFEKKFQWNGLCFEPNSELFAKVIRERTRCQNVNGILCSHAKKKVQYIEFQEPFHQENGILDLMDDYKQKQVSRYPVKRRKDLQCYNLHNASMTYLKTNHVDVLSLDVEGSELNVLKSINFEMLKIDVLFVEASHEKHVISFLTQVAPYVHVAKVGDDNIFFRRDSVYMSIYNKHCACQTNGECRYKLFYPHGGWICSKKSEPT